MTKQNAAVEKVWTNARATHARGYVGIQVNQPDKDGNIEVITFAAPHQPQNDNIAPDKEERAEDKRFRAAILTSWDKVWTGARHLYRRGAAVRIAPCIIRPTFDDRDEYGDSANFEYHWVRVEVKSRGLDFPPFKYKTIFVDRVGKIENTPATLYVSLNKQSTHIALVPLNSRDHWVGPTTVFDRKKRYPVVVFEAPIKVVRLMQIRDSV